MWLKDESDLRKGIETVEDVANIITTKQKQYIE